jgi:CheY-like chemotaxis protein
VDTCEILLVDDEPDILEVTGTVLSDEGYRVTVASSGEAAVELLNTKCFDVVITDLNMNETDGFAVLNKAKQQNPETRVILSTGSHHLTPAQILQFGFDDHLAKPYRLHNLVKQVARCSQRLQDERDMGTELAHVPSLACPIPARRIHARYTVQKIVSYAYSGKQFLTLTLDLGLGGMKIKTHLHLPIDECLDFKLILGKDPIWPSGRIAYSGVLANQESASGVQFMNLSDCDASRLQHVLGTLVEEPRPLAIHTGGEVSTGEERTDQIARH